MAAFDPLQMLPKPIRRAMATTTKLLAGFAALILTGGVFWLAHALWLERDVLTDSAAVKILAPVVTLVSVSIAALLHRERTKRRQ